MLLAVDDQTRILGGHNHIVLPEHSHQVVPEGAVALLGLGLQLVARELAPWPQLIAVNVVKLALLVSLGVILSNPLGVSHRPLHPLLVPFVERGRVSVRLEVRHILDRSHELLLSHLGGSTQRLLLGTLQLPLKCHHLLVGICLPRLRKVLGAEQPCLALCGLDDGRVEVSEGVDVLRRGRNHLARLVKGGGVQVDKLVVVRPKLRLVPLLLLAAGRGLGLGLVALALLGAASLGLVHGGVQIGERVSLRRRHLGGVEVQVLVVIGPKLLLGLKLRRDLCLAGLLNRRSSLVNCGGASLLVLLLSRCVDLLGNLCLASLLLHLLRLLAHRLLPLLLLD
mmetsp:Transcript_44281/g.110885  ORF Transcript_44281/g.110885 Transcript_44281/m.110885 type:complete len:338 (+) Transcript_44281:502-1515(+)